MMSSKIGEILINEKKISEQQINQIAEFQNKNNLKFGEAAKKLGILTDDDINFALAKQFSFSYIKHDDSSININLIAATKPFSPQVENLRRLRNDLLINWLKEDKKSFVICAYESEINKEVLISNLGVLFSQIGLNTLIIDADLRDGTLNEVFEVDNKLGLSDLLIGRCDMNIIHKHSKIMNLDILPSGTKINNPQELLARGGNIYSLINTLNNSYDVILLNTTTFDSGFDAQMLISVCKYTVPIFQKNKSIVKNAEIMKKAIMSAEGIIIGSILTV